MWKMGIVVAHQLGENETLLTSAVHSALWDMSGYVVGRHLKLRLMEGMFETPKRTKLGDPPPPPDAPTTRRPTVTIRGRKGT